MRRHQRRPCLRPLASRGWSRNCWIRHWLRECQIITLTVPTPFGEPVTPWRY
jgi:hypothetical protein